MELQEGTLRLSRMIETIIRRCFDPKWRFPGGPSLLILENGHKELHKLWPYDGIANDRVVDYVVYQVYRTRRTLENGYSWRPDFLFSDYSIEKYRKQFIDEGAKSGIDYYINQWLDDAELTRADLVRMIEEPKQNGMRKYIYMESEEQTKMRFLNTEAGYLLCQRNTTGWAPLSVACCKCDFNKQCEQLTEKRLPELVRLRKENV